VHLQYPQVLQTSTTKQELGRLVYAGSLVANSFGMPPASAPQALQTTGTGFIQFIVDNIIIHSTSAQAQH
jgi:hypothetical protein